MRALRDALTPALLRPPCFVAFSGGRDSALLLAVAADVAAAEGLDLPIPLTLRYPDDPAADEADWQELTIAHLARRGLNLNWIRSEIAGELDIVGPLIAPVLQAHQGPTYPPALAPTILLTERARGGSLVTGNGGDEVLGVHRSAVLRAVGRRRLRGLTRADWAAVAFAAGPVAARRWMVARETPGRPWLRPPWRERIAAMETYAAADRPLRWNRSVRSVMATRAARIGASTRETVAARTQCLLVEPLRAPRFIESWAQHGGSTGGLMRAGAMRFLAGPLLPGSVAGRRHKAFFNRSRFGPVTRRFAAEWDGTGVDRAAVDVAELRRTWLAEIPSAASAMLLQQAWLATEGLR